MKFFRRLPGFFILLSCLLRLLFLDKFLFFFVHLVIELSLMPLEMLFYLVFIIEIFKILPSYPILRAFLAFKLPILTPNRHRIRPQFLQSFRILLPLPLKLEQLLDHNILNFRILLIELDLPIIPLINQPQIHCLLLKLLLLLLFLLHLKDLCLFLLVLPLVLKHRLLHRLKVAIGIVIFIVILRSIEGWIL